jgi:hypothetical protein
MIFVSTGKRCARIRRAGEIATELRAHRGERFAVKCAAGDRVFIPTFPRLAQQRRGIAGFAVAFHERIPAPDGGGHLGCEDERGRSCYADHP